MSTRLNDRFSGKIVVFFQPTPETVRVEEFRYYGGPTISEQTVPLVEGRALYTQYRTNGWRTNEESAQVARERAAKFEEMGERMSTAEYASSHGRTRE